MDFIEKVFEGLLWRSRYVVLFAVVASMAAAIAIFYMATVDVVYLVSHILHYADPSLTPSQQMEADELEHAIQHCLNALPTDFRAVVVMADIEGLDYTDVAKAVGAMTRTIGLIGWGVGSAATPSS